MCCTDLTQEYPLMSSKKKKKKKFTARMFNNYAHKLYYPE